MKRSVMGLLAGLLLAISFAAFAGPGAIEGVEKQPMNVSAIAMFMVFVLATLGITKWSAPNWLTEERGRFPFDQDHSRLAMAMPDSK